MAKPHTPAQLQAVTDLLNYMPEGGILYVVKRRGGIQDYFTIYDYELRWVGELVATILGKQYDVEREGAHTGCGSKTLSNRLSIALYGGLAADEQVYVQFL